MLYKYGHDLNDPAVKAYWIREFREEELEADLPLENNIWWQVKLSRGKKGDGSKNERILALQKNELAPLDIELLYTLTPTEQRNFYRSYVAHLHEKSPSLTALLNAVIYFDNMYGTNNHVSQKRLGVLAARYAGRKKAYSREWVNKGLQALCSLGLISKLPDLHRLKDIVSCRTDRCCRYVLGWWARDLKLRRDLSLYMCCLAAKLHTDFTLININTLVRETMLPDVELANSTRAHEMVPHDMSASEWQKDVRSSTYVTTLEYENPQSFPKSKGNDRKSSATHTRNLTEPLDPRERLGSSSDHTKESSMALLTEPEGMAPRPLAEILTNSIDPEKMASDRALIEQNKSAMMEEPDVNYYPPDEDAQPYYQPLKQRVPTARNPRQNWVPPVVKTLSPEEANKRRIDCIMDDNVMRARDNMAKVCGQTYADMYFSKMINNYDKELIVPAHYIVE